MDATRGSDADVTRSGGTIQVRRFLATPWPYVAWLVLSAAGLGTARIIDPYVLGLFSLVTGCVSAVLLLAASLWSPRNLLLALAGSLPTAWALYVLGTYNWA
jgi:hypothetical protein